MRFFLDAAFVVLVVLIVAIPKSGAYVNQLPLYLNYVFIAALMAPMFLLRILFIGKVSIPYLRYLSLVSPFWVIWIACYALYGYESLGFFVGQLYIFFIIPIFFLLIEIHLSARRYLLVENALRVSVRLAASFGIFSFFYAVIFGDYFNIPYLTTAGGEVVEEVWQKNNKRENLYKLVSTYNNGNIYGVCMLMLAPLYFIAEKRRLFLAIFFLSIVLTLSRTAWAGLAVALVLIGMSRMTRLRVVGLFFGMSAFLSLIYMFSLRVGGDDFLLDSSLGNRDLYFWMLDEFRFFPSEPIGVIIEIPYISIYYDFGLLGVLAFILFMLAPLMIGGASPFAKEYPARLRAVNAGLWIYIAMTFSDGAMILVPSMLIYTLLIMIKFYLIRSKGIDTRYQFSQKEIH